MRRILISIFIAAAACMSVAAQDARQRKMATIVQDVLAAMPTDDLTEFYVQMADLAGAAPESVVYLASRLQPADAASNNLLEYAISGVVRYATDPANAGVKENVKKGIEQAIQSCTDQYNRQFLEAQLRLMNPPVVKYEDVVENPDVLVKSDDANDRCRAMWTYVDQKGPKSAKKLIAALKDEEGAVRTSALRASAAFADDAFYAKVVKSYPKLSEAGKVDVLTWFGDVDAASALDLVLSEAKGDDKTALAAIEAAAKIGGESAADVLFSLLPCPEHSSAALEALRYTDVDLDQRILARLPEAEGSELSALLDLASDRRVYDAAPVIMKYAQSSDKALASEAAAALSGVVLADDFEVLAGMLEGAKADVDSYVSALSASAKGISSDELYDKALALVNQSADPERFYPVLAQSGKDNAVYYLRDRYDAGSEAALLAMAQMNNRRVINSLLKAAEKDQNYLKRVIEITDATIVDNDRKSVEYCKALDKTTDPKIKRSIVWSLGNIPTMNAFIKLGSYLDDPDLAYPAANGVKWIASQCASDLDYNALNTILRKAVPIFEAAGGADDGYAIDEIKKILSDAKPFEKYELSAEEQAEGFELLFDGTDLSKWVGDTVGYMPVNGTIQVTAGYGDEKNLYTRKEYEDFVLRFEFRFNKPGVNNGIGVRTPRGVDAAYYGMCEVQVLDHDDPIYADLMDYQVHGSVYGIVPAKRIVHKPLGEWSYEEIRVVGDRVTVTVNGEVIVDADVREACQGHNVAPDGSRKNPYTVDGYNHPGLFNKKGHICFCGHGAGLQYRNVRVLDLTAAKSAAKGK